MFLHVTLMRNFPFKFLLSFFFGVWENNETQNKKCASSFFFKEHSCLLLIFGLCFIIRDHDLTDMTTSGGYIYHYCLILNKNKYVFLQVVSFKTKRETKETKELVVVWSDWYVLVMMSCGRPYLVSLSGWWPLRPNFYGKIPLLTWALLLPQHLK